MKRVRIAMQWLLGLAVATAGGAAWAADEPNAWHVTVTPYAWLAGLSGDVTVRGIPASVDVGFIDILDTTDSLIGFQGHIAVTRGPIGGYADATYLKMRANDVGSTNLDLTNKMWLVEFGAQYRILDTTDAEGRGVGLDAYVGGRYTSLAVDLNTLIGSTSQSQSWIDPVVGGRATFGLSEHLLLVVGGDVGGFGVGSDFAWSALGLLGFRWQGAGLEWAVLAGYKALYQDYSTGSGTRRFKWDTTMHGPIIGLSVRF